MASQQFEHDFPNSNNNHNNNTEGIDPSELSMQGGMFMPYSFGSQQNMSSVGFNVGNSGIDTDELLDLDLNGQNGMHRSDASGFVQDQHPDQGLSVSHQSMMTNMYSNTPEGAPIQSPFLHGSFNYDQFNPINQQAHGTTSQTHSSQFEQHYLSAKARTNLQVVDRSSSDALTPMTPKTPALGALSLGTPESGSFPGQPIRTTNLHHRHQKALSGQWDGNPGSAHSFMESPISSPGNHSHHAGISEILKSGKHASLPTKVDAQTAQALESQEAKRRRRRASHNLVERRRRDNINERIQDLSHLVPQHRLEDEKVRKQLLNNSALAQSGNTNHSATSLLAGGSGRRAAGNITMGLPIEEKEKGPNKGDILNGAVSWMRDLMWALHVKFQQESELAELISSLGGTWPFEQTEEEKRMRTELLDAMEKNDPSTFTYSRGPGSGLRVPKHTDLAGEPLPQQNGSDQSPAFSNGNSNGNSNGSNNNSQAQFWNSSGHAGISFKEEDEYQMEMN